MKDSFSHCDTFSNWDSFTISVTNIYHDLLICHGTHPLWGFVYLDMLLSLLWTHSRYVVLIHRLIHFIHRVLYGPLVRSS